MKRGFHSTIGPRHDHSWPEWLSFTYGDYPEDHIPMSREVRHQYAAVDLSPADSEHGPFGNRDVMAVSPVDGPEFNSIVSITAEGRHVPMIDLDFDCELTESSTAGHYHLILHGKTLDPAQYRKLLTTLRDLGLLEQGNLTRFEENGMSVLRKPDRVKRKTDGVPRIEAPWTDGQLRALERWIERTGYAGYVCEGWQPVLPEDRKEPDYVPEHDAHPLILTPNGWMCRFGMEGPRDAPDDWTDPMQPWDWHSFPAFILTDAEPANPRVVQIADVLELTDLRDRLVG